MSSYLISCIIARPWMKWMPSRAVSLFGTGTTKLSGLKRIQVQREASLSLLITLIEFRDNMLRRSSKNRELQQVPLRQGSSRKFWDCFCEKKTLFCVSVFVKICIAYDLFAFIPVSLTVLARWTWQALEMPKGIEDLWECKNGARLSIVPEIYDF